MRRQGPSSTPLYFWSIFKISETPQYLSDILHSCGDICHSQVTLETIMLFTRLSFGFLLGLTGASVLPNSNLVQLEKRQDVSSTTSSTSATAADCTNGPNTRGCWDSSGTTNFSIATDAETSWPNTGVIVPVGYKIYPSVESKLTPVSVYSRHYC
jgi:hypothetical protein